MSSELAFRPAALLFVYSHLRELAVRIAWLLVNFNLQEERNTV